VARGLEHWGRALLAAALLLVALPAASDAHIRTSAGYSTIRQEGANVRYDLALEHRPLAAAVGTGDVESYLLSRITVSVDGVECEGGLRGTGREERDGRPYVRLLLIYECPGSGSGNYEVRYGVLADGAVVDDHTNVADYAFAAGRGTFVFDAGHHELAAGETGLLSAGSRFVGMGIDHILFGIDHVLFLVALLLGAQGFMSVVKLATTFTVAHSTTLALGVLGWVDVPPEIVEPLIALSIVYVAVENVVGGESRHRLAVVFGFGLLHGLGFAGTLSFTDDVSGRLLGSLLSFNIGIELGQALIIALVFPLLLAVRRFRWSPFAHAGATSIAAAFGLLWFIERSM
jgi:hypothetical protein